MTERITAIPYSKTVMYSIMIMATMPTYSPRLLPRFSRPPFMVIESTVKSRPKPSASLRETPRFINSSRSSAPFRTA